MYFNLSDNLALLWQETICRKLKSLNCHEATVIFYNNILLGLGRQEEEPTGDRRRAARDQCRVQVYGDLSGGGH